jgi:hypothetical protein
MQERCHDAPHWTHVLGASVRMPARVQGWDSVVETDIDLRWVRHRRLVERRRNVPPDEAQDDAQARVHRNNRRRGAPPPT